MSVTYANGQIPAGVLTTVASGTDSFGHWEFQTTTATWARWQNAKKYAETHFGRTLYIRPGWNMYRPLAAQKVYRAAACKAGNCNGASVPKYSSHGGNWNGRDCLAIDVDPNGLSWAQVWEACRAAGFSCGVITASISGIPGGEPWHIIDFNAFGPVPAGGDSKPFPGTEPEPITKEDEMKPILLQLDPNVDGRWVLINYLAGTYWPVSNGWQLDRIKEDDDVRQLAGAQPTSVVDGLSALPAKPVAASGALEIDYSKFPKPPSAVETAKAIRDVLRTDPLK